MTNYFTMFDKNLYLILTEYLNSVLIIDLFLSITNPFVVRESRRKYYYGVMGVSVLVLVVLTFAYGFNVR